MIRENDNKPQPMSKAPQPRRNPANAANKRRAYHSPIREKQAAETRERIIASGVRLVHGFKDWDWKNLNARAVALGAGVSERTVHRHFTSERKLRDAVLQRLVQESGIKLDSLRLDNYAQITEKLFRYLSTFASTPVAVEDPSLANIDAIRRGAVLAAVREATPDWSESEREIAAGALDLAWTPPSYDRLVAAWGLEPTRAIDTLTWLIKVLETAIRDGHKPDIST